MAWTPQGRVPTSILIFAAGLFVIIACSKGSPSDPGGSIVISVPFDRGDSPYGLIPMGETVYHPKPQNPLGHPGIDFQWNHAARILASAGGTVVGIEKGSWPDTWDVGVRSGSFLISYTELESYNPDLRVGKEIAAGTLIGTPWHPTGTHAGYRMIHWNFGYDTGHPIYPDRLCPMSYFDSDSRVLMETIWASTVWEYKSQFPDICSGDYKGKNQ